MNDHWADVFVKILVLSGFALLLLAAIFMAIDAYLVEKSGRPSTGFEKAGVGVFGLWFLNNIALSIFAILAEWFTLDKWEIWVAYGISVLIGVAIVRLSRHCAKKEDRRTFIFVFLIIAVVFVSLIGIVALMTGHY